MLVDLNGFALAGSSLVEANAATILRTYVSAVISLCGLYSQVIPK